MGRAPPARERRPAASLRARVTDRVVSVRRRTGQQCAQRWRHKVNPNIKKEKWSVEEDALLTQLVAEHGNRWAEIARHIEGRTDQQCMGRWTRHLDPNISR